MQDHYVTRWNVPFTNDEGDVYLVNTATGEQSRITYTPAVLEMDIHWTEDGDIAFTEMIYKDHLFTVEQAMNVEVVPRENIVTPEPVDVDALFGDGNQSSDLYQPNQLISPDSAVVAHVDHASEQYILYIGPRDSDISEMRFSVQLPDGYEYTNVLIGWRPTDFIYPEG